MTDASSYVDRRRPARHRAIRRGIVIGLAATIAGGFAANAVVADSNPTKVALGTNRPTSPGRADQMNALSSRAPGLESPSTTAAAQPRAVADTATTATTIATPAPPHFATPEAAMIYLAAAWNARDAVSLRHVTNPAARVQLDAMHREAVDLRFDHCDRRPYGDYTCYFHHGYLPGTSTAPGRVGQAIFLVGPALTPGWYMTVFEGCG